MLANLYELAAFIMNLKAPDIPFRVMRMAEERALDNISVGIAASDDPLIQRISQLYGNLSGDGQMAAVWGQKRKVPLLTAIFLNALMCHLLESDDVHTKSKAHIGAAVIPAAWALAETTDCSGEDFLTAIIAGYEIEARIAMAFDVKAHRKLGWHVTATAGVFGAAAACGKLLGLDADKMVSCLGLAGAQSFGTWAFLAEGTNSKILNPARAAVNGCEAAILASAGMNGPAHILDAQDGGLFHLMTSCPHPEVIFEGLGTEWEICNVDNKVYPCCRSTHCAIDSGLLIREQVNCDCIERIVIETYLIGKQQCATTEASLNPMNSVEAKFSTPYCVAAAIVRGKVTFEEFEPEVIADKRIRKLMRNIEVRASDHFTAEYPEHWGCRSTVYCKDGSCMEFNIPDALGSIYKPLTKEQAKEKAVSMMSKTLTGNAVRAANDLLGLQKLVRLPSL